MPSAETDYLQPGEELATVDSHHGETVGQQTRAGLLERAERRNRIVRLRRLGMTYEQISLALSKATEDEGGAIDVSVGQVGQIIRAYLDEMATENRESLDQLRELENMRLDHMQSRLAEKIEKGSVPAVKAALAVMERRAKLNGLDAPEVKGFIGAFGHVGEVADPEKVEQLERAFFDAFVRPGIPDTAIEGNGGPIEPARS